MLDVVDNEVTSRAEKLRVCALWLYDFSWCAVGFHGHHELGVESRGIVSHSILIVSVQVDQERFSERLLRRFSSVVCCHGESCYFFDWFAIGIHFRVDTSVGIEVGALDRSTVLASIWSDVGFVLLQSERSPERRARLESRCTARTQTSSTCELSQVRSHLIFLRVLHRHRSW